MWRDAASLPLFRTTLLGYAGGLGFAMIISRVFSAAQPALLWIVPAMLVPLLAHARLARGNAVAVLWAGPAESPPPSTPPAAAPAPAPAY